MGFLDNFLGAQKDTAHSDWKALTDINQLEDIVSDSYEKPIVIFKHSIRCGISSMVKYQLEEQWNLSDLNFDFYYLDLITYRPISNDIAKRFKVVHQSPQIIIIKDGQAIFDTSHHMISTLGIREVLEQEVG